VYAVVHRPASTQHAAEGSSLLVGASREACGAAGAGGPSGSGSPAAMSEAAPDKPTLSPARPSSPLPQRPGAPAPSSGGALPPVVSPVRDPPAPPALGLCAPGSSWRAAELRNLSRLKAVATLRVGSRLMPGSDTSELLARTPAYRIYVVEMRAPVGG
jgi:hypothetical protein